MSFSFRKRLKLFPHPKAPRLGDDPCLASSLSYAGGTFIEDILQASAARDSFRPTGAPHLHTSICGLNQLGSSRLAVLIATN
jgi:hypothetical protein